MPRIVVVDPRPSWPGDFERVAGDLAAVLDESALAIDHIGSTAVPGLAAKDVIDVQVSVAADDLDAAAGRLHDAGWVSWDDIRTDHVPPGAVLEPVELEKRLASEPPGSRRANVHLRVPGRFNHRYALLCRDYLRCHPGAAAAYGRIKVVLAARYPDDVDAYYDVKDPVFDLIMAAAEDWAGASGWSTTYAGAWPAASAPAR